MLDSARVRVLVLSLINNSRVIVRFVIKKLIIDDVNYVTPNDALASYGKVWAAEASLDYESCASLRIWGTKYVYLC